MRRRPPRSTRTDTLVPYTTLFRSQLLSLYQNKAPELKAAEVRMQAGNYGWKVAKGAYSPRLTLGADIGTLFRSEEHTSELQSLMRISYAVFCLKKKRNNNIKRSMSR